MTSMKHVIIATHVQTPHFPRPLAIPKDTQKVVAFANSPIDRAFGDDIGICSRLPARTIHLYCLLMKLPAPLRILWKGWMIFSHVLGIIMSTIILTVLWIVGFGIYAIILKIISIPSLFKKHPETYWIDVKPETVDNMRYPF